MARWLVKIKYISLVNLILDRMAVVELIQGKANHDRLLAELKLILIDGSRRSQVLKDYERSNEQIRHWGGHQKLLQRHC